MLADVVNYSHEYIVSNDKIAYKLQDGMSYNMVWGYKTLFAAFFEHGRG